MGCHEAFTSFECEKCLNYLESISSPILWHGLSRLAHYLYVTYEAKSGFGVFCGDIHQGNLGVTK